MYVAFAVKLSNNCSLSRSNRPEVLCKKGVLRNFPKFKGKHLCQSHFFNCNFIKNETLA